MAPTPPPPDLLSQTITNTMHLSTIRTTSTAASNTKLRSGEFAARPLLWLHNGTFTGQDCLTRRCRLAIHQTLLLIQPSVPHSELSNSFISGFPLRINSFCLLYQRYFGAQHSGFLHNSSRGSRSPQMDVPLLKTPQTFCLLREMQFAWEKALELHSPSQQ